MATYPRLDRDLFTFIRDTDTFVVEASDLAWPPGHVPDEFTMVFDAGDTTIEVPYVCKGNVENDEGELVYVEFQSKAEGPRVTVFND